MEFKDLRFRINDEKLIITLLKYFECEIDIDVIENIAFFEIDENAIEFKDIDEGIAIDKFLILLERAFNQNLKCIITGKRAKYIHSNSGIPLIGNNFFGIVDRNTSIMEVKPITGCNLNCIYCSVDEGKDSKKQMNFVIECDYLVEELKKVIELKDCDNIEVHIGCQGEPLLYAPLVELIEKMSKIPKVKDISIDTNGTLLTKELIDDLYKAGLTQMNVSLNAFENKLCSEIANTCYSADHVKKMIEYASDKIHTLVSPVILNTINEKELDELIKFRSKLPIVNKNRPIFGVQKFLYYKFGRNPVKEQTWDDFVDYLKLYEQKYNVKLLLDFKQDFNLKNTKPLLKPFKKNKVYTVEIKALGQQLNEYIGVYDDRNLTVISKENILGKKVDVKITRTKHNIFYGAIYRRGN